MTNITIVGAGLTGMIAGHIFPQARILEAQTFDQQQAHKALLRFRSQAVSEVTGIPFQQVTVRKGIWSHTNFIEPNIRAANAYSLKCTGRILPRSIWNIEPCQRWIAPDNFIELLQRNLAGRIEYGKAFSFYARKVGKVQLKDVDVNYNHIITTVPMGIVAKQLEVSNAPEFKHQPIHVYRFNLGSSTNVHQTVYFPFDDTAVYRASITGSILIIEAIAPIVQMDLMPVARAFHLDPLSIDDFEAASQRFGKIAPVDEAWRRNFIFEMTDRFGLYSLGRFGTWRNMLLDDVVHDCAVIKRLMLADDYTKMTLRMM